MATPTDSAAGDPTLGIILAGGHSRRLGQDKATVAIPEGTPLGVAIHAVSGAGLRPVVIGRLAMTDFPAVASHPDDVANGGPAAGIATGLRLAAGNAIVVVPCDLPALTAEWLAWLITTWREMGRPVALAPTTAGKIHPIPGLYTPAVAPVLEPGRGLYPLFSRPGMATVPMPSKWSQVLEDIDTPDDLARHHERKAT